LQQLRELLAERMHRQVPNRGVSKATIYRRWPSKETLALDALYQSWADVEPKQPDTGSIRSDLWALLLPWVRRLRARPYSRVIAALLTEAQTDPAFEKQYRAHFVEPRPPAGAGGDCPGSRPRRDPAKYRR